MKKALLLLPVIICFSLKSFSPLLSWTPDFPVESTQALTITADASKGKQGLYNYSATTDVYVHTGVITNFSANSSDWKHVKFNQNFNQPNSALQATYLRDTNH